MSLSSINTLVVVDVVEWSEVYPNPHPIRNVAEWFARFLRDIDGLSVSVVSATGAVQQAIESPGVFGVIVSGSPRDAWVKDHVNDRLIEMIRHCQDRSLPYLGVCFGHQILAVAMSGEVAREPAGVEFGNVPITLTLEGKNDPLFEGLPEEFMVLESHQDAVLKLPPDATLLATGRHTRVQGFRCGEWLRGVQFHPEYDPEILRFIWEPRRVTWRDRCSFDIDTRMRELEPTPLGPRILKNFVKICRRRLNE